MRTKKIIFKYPIGVGRNVLELPKDSTFLSFQSQNNNLVAWFLVEPGEPKIERSFKVIGTGWEFDWEPDFTYLGTAQNGSFVWHLFEYTFGI